MSKQVLETLYIQQLNDYLLPDLDYAKLYRSCNRGDKEYAGETLKRMHDIFVDIYGTSKLNHEHEFVCVPGVIKSRKSGKTVLALLDISIEDGGEHFGTQILSQVGVLDLHGQEGLNAVITAELFMPYDYWYTVHIPGDHHVNDHAPEDVQNLLDHCQSNTPQMEMK